MQYLVNLLPLADHIIALDLRGKIAEQGTLEELRGIDGYVKSFGIKQNMSTVSAPLEASPNSSTLGSQGTSLVARTKDDGTRQLGEFSVYSYYCKQAGIVTTSIFLTCSMLSGFCSTFPCKVLLRLLESKRLT